ncbi:hypothetical protein GQ53DRAFT_834654 [Thozetella sp. PMI_491]|nr:hypothetical protein GQ53DRAFT_834654 [Thozetella sp. PMI_491]
MVRLPIYCSLTILQAATVLGVLIPPDLAPGLYSIPFDSNGTATGEPLLLRSVNIQTENPYSRRQQGPPTLPTSQAKCGTGGTIANTFATAKASLQSECDRGDTYPKRTAIVFKSGNAVAYFCNFDAANRCWRQEVDEAMNRIVQACGIGKGGELYIPSYQKSYGGDNSGQQICRF